MKILKMIGQIFLICCWCLIITIGVVLIRNRTVIVPEQEPSININENQTEQIVIPLEKLIGKYKKDLESYMDDLKIETVNESTLKIGFVLKDGQDPSAKIPMLKKISTLIEAASGKEISFEVSVNILDGSQIDISVHDCTIDSFSIPNFLIEPLNQMMASQLKEIIKRTEGMDIKSFSLVENQIILIGEVPEEVQNVWLEN